MTDFEDALTQISDSIETSLNTLISDDTVSEVIVGSKTRGALQYPYLKFIYDIAKCDNTTIGSIGNNEAWTVPVRVGAVVKETDSPQTGMIAAASIISKARNLLLTDRQLGIPNIVRKVDSNEIQIVPYPFGKKKTLYGAGTILNILFIINNE